MAAGRDQLLIEIQAIIDNSVLKESEKILGEIEKQSKKTEKSLDRLGSSFGKIGALVAGVLSAKKVKEGIDLASDFTETRNKLESVFGGLTSDMDNFMNGMSDTLNLGKRQLEKEVADVGGMLAGMGFKNSDLVDNTETALKAAKDLASFYNLDLNDAIRMVMAGLTGETQALSRQGILIKDQDMEEYAKQHKQVWKNLDGSAKAQMRLNAVVDKMKLAEAAGDAVKTKNEYASVEKSIQSLSQTILGDFFMSFKDALLPSMEKTRDFLKENQKEIVDFGSKVGDFVGKILDAAGGITDFVMENQSLVKSVGIAIGVMYGLSTVIGIVNALMTANPVGLVVVAIGALVAGLIYAYQESEVFRSVVDSAFSMLKEAAKVIFPIIKKEFEILMSVIKKTGEVLGIVFGKIKDGWDWLVNSKAGKFVAKLMGNNGKEINISVSEEETGKSVKQAADKIVPKLPINTNQDARVIKEKVNRIEEKTNITEKEVVTRTKENKTQKLDLNIKIDVQTISIDLQERLQKVVRSELESYEREQLVNVGLV